MPPPWFWMAATAGLLLAVLFWMRGTDSPATAIRPERSAVSAAPDSRARADDREATTSPPPFPRVDRIAGPPAEPAPMPAPTASDGNHEDAAVATATPAREGLPAAPTAPASAIAAADAPAPLPDAPASAPASAPPPAARGAIARLSQLPPAERKQLPAMKLSMHMWNERPAQRFVIIDGHRYIEGDRVGGAVITAIDGEGVILDLHGRPVRIPIR